MTNQNKIPGEKIAALEEYLPGSNTFDDGEVIRATTIGSVQFDTSERSASVKSDNPTQIPKIGDMIIGTVEANLPSMIAVSIKFVNGKKTKTNVECVCVTRHLRKKNIALAQDVVKAEIISNINGTLHGKIDPPECGVLFTKCRKCFGIVTKMRDAVKCKDCGWIDDRKLSLDFGKSDFLE